MSSAINEPAIVMGMPVKTLLKVDTLYLASLKAPAIGKSIVITYPIILNSPRKVFQLKTAGAAPKEIKSARESSSFPRGLSALKNLAILPSYLSTSAAAIMNPADTAGLSERVNKMASIPQAKFIKVNTLGIMLRFI